MSVEDLVGLVRWSLWGVAIVTTVFPVWYGLFNAWWSTRAGTSILLLSIALAAAWDLTLLFWYWVPDDARIALWMQIAVHVLTMAAGLYILYALWYNLRNDRMITTTKEEDRHDRTAT